MDERKQHGHGEGHREEHSGREPPLRAERLDLAAKAGTGSDGRRHRVEDFHQVTADLGVDLDRLHDPAEILAADPARHGVQRFGQRPSELHLVHDAAQLVAHRRVDFSPHRVERLHDPVARSQAAGELLEQIGQLSLERGSALRGSDSEKQPEDEGCERREHERRGNATDEESGKKADRGGTRPEYQVFTRAECDAGVFEASPQRFSSTAMFQRPFHRLAEPALEVVEIGRSRRSPVGDQE